MNKLATLFYTAVYLITEHGRKALIIITAFLSVAFAAVGINNGYCFMLSLVFMLAMIIAICRYYDCKYAEERK